MNAHAKTFEPAGRSLLCERVCRERLEILSRNVLLAAAYFMAGKLGLKLAFVHASATAVWAPTGIALAALLVYGRSVLPAIFIGAFLVNLTTAGGIASSLGIALGNTLEGLVGASLVERFAGGRQALSRSRSILRYTVLAGLLSPMVGASGGASTLWLSGLARTADLKAIWLTWWLGDASGALIVAPALLLWSAAAGVRYGRGKVLELAGLSTALLLVSRIVFGGLLPTAGHNYPLDFLCWPILIWAAFRFGPKETALSGCALSALAIGGTLQGFGPFVRPSPNESLLLLQVFMAETTIVAIAVASVVAERRSAESGLRLAHADLETRIQKRTAELSREVAERQRAENELQRSNTELNLFASIAAHELQEPLRKLLTFAGLLKAGQQEDDYVERMRDCAKRMSRLVDDILALSRITTNARALEPVSLDEVLGEVKADFEDRLTRAGGRLTVSSPLPALRADALQLRQLFGNLVSNAFKFRDKERPLRIAVRGRRRQDGFIELAIQDNGVGFDERYLDRIFKPFQRLHPRGQYEGSGMGLAICQRIVLRHGGAISAKSQPDQGSTFIVTLPG